MYLFLASTTYLSWCESFPEDTCNMLFFFYFAIENWLFLRKSFLLAKWFASIVGVSHSSLFLFGFLCLCLFVCMCAIKYIESQPFLCVFVYVY